MRNIKLVISAGYKLQFSARVLRTGSSESKRKREVIKCNTSAPSLVYSRLLRLSEPLGRMRHLPGVTWKKGVCVRESERVYLGEYYRKIARKEDFL